MQQDDFLRQQRAGGFQGAPPRGGGWPRAAAAAPPSAALSAAAPCARTPAPAHVIRMSHRWARVLSDPVRKASACPITGPTEHSMPMSWLDTPATLCCTLAAESACSPLAQMAAYNNHRYPVADHAHLEQHQAVDGGRERRRGRGLRVAANAAPAARRCCGRVRRAQVEGEAVRQQQGDLHRLHALCRCRRCLAG